MKKCLQSVLHHFEKCILKRNHIKHITVLVYTLEAGCEDYVEILPGTDTPTYGVSMHRIPSGS